MGSLAARESEVLRGYVVGESEHALSGTSTGMVPTMIVGDR